MKSEQAQQQQQQLRRYLPELYCCQQQQIVVNIPPHPPQNNPPPPPPSISAIPCLAMFSFPFLGKTVGKTLKRPARGWMDTLFVEFYSCPNKLCSPFRSLSSTLLSPKRQSTLLPRFFRGSAAGGKNIEKEHRRRLLCASLFFFFCV